MRGSVGRIVHFTPPDTENVVREPIAALITRVYDGGEMVNIVAFPDHAPSYHVSSVPYSEEPRCYSWRWPVKVKETAPSVAAPVGGSTNNGDV